MANKLIFLLVFSLGLHTTIRAQNDQFVIFSLQVGVGNFRGDPIPDKLDLNINLALSVAIEKSLNDHLFLRGGLNYSKMSVSNDETSFNLADFDPVITSTKIDISVNALTLPIMTGFKTKGSTRFIAAAGPFVSLLFNDENILSKSLNYGLSGTIGAEFDLGNGAIRIEAFDELGLADINDSRLEIDNNEIRTNRLGLQVSYVMNF